MNLADMHIHSMYSDGTLKPAEIVRMARARGVRLISVCDHNEIEGTLETYVLAKNAGIDFISGVEMDAIYNGLDMHILCYGADLENIQLRACIRRARRRLDEMSDTLLQRMIEDYPQLDRNEYANFAHDFRLGGWKMLQYLMHKGITARLRDGVPLYERYGVRYCDAGFDAAQDVIRAIHAAGGCAVLAHPGVIFPCEPLSKFIECVDTAMDMGLDGVECYYPRHSSGMQRALVELCRRRGALITAGSDCHGAFGHNEIGQTRTPIAQLALGKLR